MSAEGSGGKSGEEPVLSRKPGSPDCGVVIVDKEAGMTSHDVVGQVRRIFAQRRAGHAGTLDPDATGVLVVGLGRATRLLRFFLDYAKTYTCEIVLGRSTTTLDASGETTGEWDMAHVSIEEARAAARRLTGSIMQEPPMVSAVRVGGRRLHELARQGLEVERAPRNVHVERFTLERAVVSGVLAAEVICSSGTYVRSLAADLGGLLGGGAHLRNLRRTAVGPFTTADASPLGELSLAAIWSPADAMASRPSVVVTHEIEAAVCHGAPIPRADLGVVGDGPWVLLDRDGRMLALYEAAGLERTRPVVVLAAG